MAAELAVFILFFSTEWPPWFPLTLHSMAGPNLDTTNFFLIGNMQLPTPHPPNVRAIQLTWEAFQERIRQRLGVQDVAGVRYVCANCTYYMSDGATREQRAAEDGARKRGTLIHHEWKPNDMKPFAAFLFPELVSGHRWWAWSDVDVLFGPLLPALSRAAPAVSVVCPLAPNPWGVASWGPFTAFRVSHNTSELFRFSTRWRAVLADPKPMQFDEWWGTPPHRWRMSQVLGKLARRGRIALSAERQNVGEARGCAGCDWCPCGAVSFEWRSAGGLRVNGGGEAVVLLHLATGKATWKGAVVPPFDPAAGCVRGRVGDAPVLEEGMLRLVRNRPPAKAARLVSYRKQSAAVERC